MPQNVSKYGVPDGDYTLSQIQSNRALGCLLPSAGPESTHVTQVRDGWATAVAKPKSPAPRAVTKVETVFEPSPDTYADLTYQEVKLAAKSAGYDGKGWSRSTLLKWLEDSQ